MSLTLFSTKGGPLTNAEVDGNFTYLEGRNNATDAAKLDKAEVGQSVAPFVAEKLDKTAVGQSVAPLVAGKVPLGNLPDSVVSGLSYKGTWNAATNTPNLTTVQASGSYYIVEVAGTFGGTPYAVGDWIISNGTAWQKFEPVEDAATVVQRVLSEATLRLNYADNEYRVYEGLAGMADKTFAQAQTLTRGSDATGITATRRLATVGSNLPRLVGNRGGLLIEGQATNLLLNSAKVSTALPSTSSVNLVFGVTKNVNGVDLESVSDSDPAYVAGGRVTGLTGHTTATFSIHLEKNASLPFVAELHIYRSLPTFVSLFRVFVSYADGSYSVKVGSGTVTVDERIPGVLRIGISTTMLATDTYNCQFFPVVSSSITGPADPTLTGEAYAGSLQLEAGPLSSYIKTEGTQVTRQADVCRRTLGAEYNPNEGTLYWEFVKSPIELNKSQSVGLYGASTLVRIALVPDAYAETSNNKVAAAITNGSPVAVIIPNVTLPVGVVSKMAMSWNKSVLALCVNGQYFTSPIVGNLPSVTALTGQNGPSIIGIAHETHRDIAYFPYALDEAELIALTTL